MPTYSKYPSAIDDSTSLPLSTDLVTEVKAEVVNRLRDAILKLENELGINPSAEFGTVKDRLDTLKLQISELLQAQTDIAALQASVANLETDVSIIETSLSNLTSTVSSIESDITALQTDVANLQSDVSTIETTILILQTAISTFETRIFADNFFTYNCDAGLQVGQAVAHSGADTVVLADATDADLPCFGVIIEKPDTTLALVQTGGQIPMAGLSANQKYYLSETMPGEITTTIPTNPGSFIQKLGFAKNNDTLMLQITHQLLFI